ncbi:MAG: hypothetical protein PHW83_07960 [Bacteroidales bacterium]|nr:hypothetical protein [Bacteroidales bacterium]
MRYDKTKILELLKEKNKYVKKLPDKVDFTIENKILKVVINEPTNNMQSNEAAFEGWILVLKTWLPSVIENVVLDFKIIPDNLKGVYYGKSSKLSHYNRFLYRIHNFSKMYPDWFSVEITKKQIISDFMEFLKNNTTILNPSSKERVDKLNKNSKERQADSNKSNTESDIERWFVFQDGKDLLYSTWNINKEKIHNQLPVGVYYKEIATDRTIFSGKKSAIDFWGIGEDEISLHLFELKRGNNSTIGVISETLFYTFILYDTCISQTPLFDYESRDQNNSDTKAIINDYKKFDKLYAHILSEKYPTLFNERVVKLIEDGLSNYNIIFDRATYDYSKKSIKVFKDFCVSPN